MLIIKERTNLKTELTRKQSKKNFPKRFILTYLCVSGCIKCCLFVKFGVVCIPDQSVSFLYLPRVAKSIMIKGEYFICFEWYVAWSWTKSSFFFLLKIRFSSLLWHIVAAKHLPSWSVTIKLSLVNIHKGMLCQSYFKNSVLFYYMRW